MDTAVQSLLVDIPVSSYDEILVPSIFEPWDEIIINQASLKTGEWVLDISAGSGTLSSLAAEKVGRSGHVIATDICPESLCVHKSKPLSPNSARIEYLGTETYPLNIPPRWFEVALCQQRLQYSPNPIAALKALHTALKPGGRLVLSIWCSYEDNPLYHALQSALDDIQTALHPWKKQPVELRWYTGNQLAAMLTQSGFQRVRVARVTVPMVFEGGIPQILAGINYAWFWAAVSTLSPAEQGFYEMKLVERLKKYIRDDKIVLNMTSFIATGLV